jgi:hypothetical protein
MNNSEISKEINLYDRENYHIESFDDEIRIDKTCKVLLQEFHKYLLNDKKIAPLKAGTLAGGADYFLRDFMIDQQRTNIFDVSADLVRRFAGNWYIITTLEPNLTELKDLLDGVSEFYAFCREKKIVTADTAIAVADACQQHDFYHQRIESFHAITDDGFIAWNKIC